MRSLLPNVRRNQMGQNQLASAQDEMDQLFDEFFNGFGLRPFNRGWDVARVPTFSPTVDVAETDKGYEITADLPGLTEKDVQVEIRDGVLTMKGEKKSEHEEEGKNFYRSERSYGSFQRQFALPGEVDEEAIDATFKNGVLKITLPKSTKAAENVKKINVKAN